MLELTMKDLWDYRRWSKGFMLVSTMLFNLLFSSSNLSFLLRSFMSTEWLYANTGMHVRLLVMCKMSRVCWIKFIRAKTIELICWYFHVLSNKELACGHLGFTLQNLGSGQGCRRVHEISCCAAYLVSPLQLWQKTYPGISVLHHASAIVASVKASRI